MSCHETNNSKTTDNILVGQKNQATKTDTVEGMFSSASDTKLLYIKPDSWEPDEEVGGALLVRDIKSHYDKKILDSISAYQGYSEQLNQNDFIICSNKTIYQYGTDSDQKKVIYQTFKDEYIENFKLSQDKKTIAILTWVYKPKTVFRLYLLDLTTLKITYKNEWISNLGEGDDPSGSIRWVNNSIGFNIDNNLYLLDLGTKQIQTITKDLAHNNGGYQYNADSATIVYFQYTGDDGNSAIRYYDFKTNVSRIATFNLNPDSIKVDNSNLPKSPTGKYSKIILENESRFYKFINQSWQNLKSPDIFVSNKYVLSNHKTGDKNYIVITQRK